jgi:hypothetical protein
MGLFAGPPALHGQVGNPAEVTGVLGDERQPMGEGSGSDENVGIAMGCKVRTGRAPHRGVLSQESVGRCQRLKAGGDRCGNWRDRRRS